MRNVAARRPRIGIWAFPGSGARIGRWLAVAALGLVPTAHANTFTVTTAADGGAGSLRQAILDANAMQVTGGGACAPHTIVFAIPGAELHTIRPLSALPSFDISITLDGYTQPGASVNTLLQGNNAQLRIELDGSLAGPTPGIVVAPSVPGGGLCGGSGSTIRGLVINRFAGPGITGIGITCPSGFSCGVGGVRINGNFIGTDVTGTIALGNAVGLEFGRNSVSNVVGDQVVMDGGPNEPLAQSRNIISGNTTDGVYLSSDNDMFPAVDNRIRNNYIGVDTTGTAPLPNGRSGIFADTGSGAVRVYDNLISAHPADGVNIADNVIGFTIVFGNGIGIGIGGVPLGNAGDAVHISGSSRGVTVGGKYPYVPFQGLSIAHNGGAGVYAEGLSGFDVVAGGFGDNGGLGLDIAPRGINPPDPVQPGSGPNELLNAPVLTALSYDPPTAALGIEGTLDTSPDTSVEIHFFLSTACDPSGYGEGQAEFDFVRVTTDAGGHADFNYQTHVQSGVFITALARRFALLPADSTLLVSEFSQCLRAGGETIFANGFDP